MASQSSPAARVREIRRKTRRGAHKRCLRKVIAFLRIRAVELGK